MGCNDSSQPPSGWSYHDDQKIREMKQRLDNVTALLCESIRHMEADGGLYAVPGLRDWWEAHKTDDEKRADAERSQRDQERQKDIDEAERLEAQAAALRNRARR